MLVKANWLKRSLLAIVVPMLALLSNAALATGERWQVNMPESVTAIGQEIYGLHMLIFYICVAVGILTFIYMFYTLIAYRKSQGAEAANFHDHLGVELTWTIVPAIILIIMAFPATSTMKKVYDNTEADLDIVVTGYQWKWKYEYLSEDGENVSFFSNLSTSQDEIYGRAPRKENYLLEVDEPVVLPVGKKVRFLITANDVIHSWWVPDLAVKKDAIPGFVNEISARPEQEGVYRGQCAELCGKDHGFMPIVVRVTSEEEYNKWYAGKQAVAAELKELMSQQLSMDDLATRGEGVYKTYCVACHGANGEGGVGKAIAGSPIATGDITKHLDITLNGVQGTAMQAFGGQLNDLDAAAVVTYQRNAFGNNMGDSVQAVDVYNFKKQ